MTAVRMPVGKYVSPAHKCLIRRDNEKLWYGLDIFSFGFCAPFVTPCGLALQIRVKINLLCERITYLDQSLCLKTSGITRINSEAYNKWWPPVGCLLHIYTLKLSDISHVHVYHQIFRLIIK